MAPGFHRAPHRSARPDEDDRESGACSAARHDQCNEAHRLCSRRRHKCIRGRPARTGRLGLGCDSRARALPHDGLRLRSWPGQNDRGQGPGSRQDLWPLHRRGDGDDARGLPRDPEPSRRQWSGDQDRFPIRDATVGGDHAIRRHHGQHPWAGASQRTQPRHDEVVRRARHQRPCHDAEGDGQLRQGEPRHREGHRPVAALPGGQVHAQPR